MKKVLFENNSVPNLPQKKRNNGCLFTVLGLCLISIFYVLGLFLWTNYTESGKKHQSELRKNELEKKDKDFKSSADFLFSNDLKTPQEKIDSTNLIRQKEIENPEFYLANLQKELENKNLSKGQRDEIQIQIKNIRAVKWAKKNINSWDDSNPKLERTVKDAMNDKDSFEHVSTEYSYKKDKVIAKMIYRGNNAFGAKVIESVTGEFDYDGNLISINQ